MSEERDPTLPVYVKVDKDNVAIRETKVTPEAIDGAIDQLNAAKCKQEIDARTAEDEKHQREKRESFDAFELCQQLEAKMLNPAGITIENPNEEGQWVYEVVFTKRIGPFPNRSHATLKAIELLDQLKKGELVK